jgi:hypothetical protein
MTNSLSRMMNATLAASMAAKNSTEMPKWARWCVSLITRAKLGPGAVARVSAVASLLLVLLIVVVAAAWKLANIYLLYGVVGGGVLIALVGIAGITLIVLVNPTAGATEGDLYLAVKRFEAAMGDKDEPTMALTSLPVPPPINLPEGMPSPNLPESSQ